MFSVRRLRLLYAWTRNRGERLGRLGGVFIFGRGSNGAKWPTSLSVPPPPKAVLQYLSYGLAQRAVKCRLVSNLEALSRTGWDPHWCMCSVPVQVWCSNRLMSFDEAPASHNMHEAVHPGFQTSPGWDHWWRPGSTHTYCRQSGLLISSTPCLLRAEDGHCRARCRSMVLGAPPQLGGRLSSKYITLSRSERSITAEGSYERVGERVGLQLNVSTTLRGSPKFHESLKRRPPGGGNANRQTVASCRAPCWAVACRDHGALRLYRLLEERRRPTCLADSNGPSSPLMRVRQPAQHPSPANTQADLRSLRARPSRRTSRAPNQNSHPPDNSSPQ
jgi:hypothetical protein